MPQHRPMFRKNIYIFIVKPPTPLRRLRYTVSSFNSGVSCLQVAEGISYVKYRQVYEQ